MHHFVDHIPTQASLIYGFFVLSGGVGALLGGFVADRIVRLVGPRGRVLTAQISVFLGETVMLLVDVDGG